MRDKMSLSEELRWRGFLNQTTFNDVSILDKANITLYLGADPTGDSLHVGHLAVYMLVRRFLEHGHKVVLLIGGGTGSVGDPGGRDDERQLMELATIEHNSKALQSQVARLFAGHDFTMVNNYDWLKDLRVLDFLRTVGKNFSMSQLVQRDYIATRMGATGAGISYAEFSYTLLQGYDFWYLHHKYGVNLEIGGSDQWGNILSGIDLIRKMDGDEVYGMTAPLVIDKTTGKKFGKSMGNPIWLDAEKTSVYQFYQFWLNASDDAVFDYLKLFTLLDQSQVEALEKDYAEHPERRVAQRALAQEVTDLVHGKARRLAVENVTAVLFGGKTVAELDAQELDDLAREIPSVERGQLSQILVDAGAAKSLGESRRLMKAGAVSVNRVSVSEDQIVSDRSLIKKGKNSFILVR